MREKLDAWECECGHVEFGMYPPEECNECWKINSFLKAEQGNEEEKLV